MWVTPQPDGGVDICFAVPEVRSEEDRAAGAKWDIVRDVVRRIDRADGPMTQVEVKAAIPKRGADVVAAIDAAVRVGALKAATGHRGAKVLEFVRSLTDDDY